MQANPNRLRGVQGLDAGQIIKMSHTSAVDGETVNRCAANPPGY